MKPTEELFSLILSINPILSLSTNTISSFFTLFKILEACSTSELLSALNCNRKSVLLKAFTLKAVLGMAISLSLIILINSRSQ